MGVSFESKNTDPADAGRRQAAEANLRVALFLRQVRWMNLILVGAVLFAGIVSIGALGLTAAPRGSARDILPFILVAAVGQLGAFYAIVNGLLVMRSFTAPNAPQTIDEPRSHWRAQLRRTRIPMLAVGAAAAIISLIFTGISVITVTGAGLGIAYILQLVILFSVATRDRIPRVD